MPIGTRIFNLSSLLSILRNKSPFTFFYCLTACTAQSPRTHEIVLNWKTQDAPPLVIPKDLQKALAEYSKQPGDCPRAMALLIPSSGAGGGGKAS